MPRNNLTLGSFQTGQLSRFQPLECANLGVGALLIEHKPPAASGALDGPNDINATYSRALPRELVHRQALAEVFVTDFRLIDDASFVVAAQWPKTHRFFSSNHGRHDPTLIAETIRQAGFVVAHRGLGVPVGHQFLMWDLEFTVADDGVPVRGAPTDLLIAVQCLQSRPRTGRLSPFTNYRFSFQIHRDQHLVGTAAASFDVGGPTSFIALRSSDGRPPPVFAEKPGAVIPITPAAVGRIDNPDVVLAFSPTLGELQLRLDRAHPVFFDHDVDHVPGMALIEAARQALRHTIGQETRVTAMKTSFRRYVELAHPCTIDINVEHTGPAILATVIFRQLQQIVAKSVVTARPIHETPQAETGVSNRKT